jgi:hypothetical protein
LRVEALEERQLLAIITTLSELQNMSLDGSHSLGNDIDASGSYFTPVGTSSSPFTGSLDGNGHKITGLRISSSAQYVGLVGYANNATLTDIVLENANIDAYYGNDWDYVHVGSLAGKAVNTNISECEVDGDVDADSYGGVYAGGLVGYSYNSSDKDMTDCVSECSVQGNSDTDYDGYGGYGGYVGGLIGRADGLDVDGCSASGNATAYGGSSYGGDVQYAGGLIGYNYLYGNSGTNSATITKSSASGDAYAYSTYDGYGGAYVYAGGLIGYSYVRSYSTGDVDVTIDQCYATGEADADGYGGGYGGAYAGGLIGYSYLYNGGTDADFAVTDCYAREDATASSSGTAAAGGLIGRTYHYATGTVTNCYSTGTPEAGSGYEGGLVGYSANTAFTSCYWDTTTSGTTDGVDNVNPDPVGVTGKTTQLMKRQSTFVNWDFDVNGLGPCSNGDWIMAGYPHLQMEFNEMETGSRIVTNVVELQMMALDLDEDYVLGGDIVADDSDPAHPDWDTSQWKWNGIQYEGFDPVGDPTTKFTGTFDGEGHEIDGLSIHRTGGDELGLFGFVDTGASLSDVGLVNVSVDADGSGSDNIAGLAGKNKGTISDCYVTGTLDGNDDIGGIAGENEGGTIQRCFADVTVAFRSGSDAIGALVGDNDGGTIRQSYSKGDLDGAYYVGGLVGYNRGTIEECYSATETGKEVKATYYAGGLVGYNYSGTINDCYSTAEVDGTYYIGGLIGRDYLGSTSRCYSTGSVTGTTYVGGLVGYSSSSSYTACYWDTQTSGTTDGVDNIDPDPAGVNGRTTQQMRSESTFAGWDFDVSGQGPRDNGVWIMAGYPHLQMEYNFMEEGSRVVTTVVELQMMALDLSEDYVLGGNIDASDTATWNWVSGSTYEGFNPVGDATNKFTGTLDGNSKTIDELTINRPDEEFVGLFGFIDHSNTVAGVKDLTLQDVNIAGGSTVGALAGANASKITGCYVMTTGNAYTNDSVAYVKGGGDITVNTNAAFTGTNYTAGKNIGGLVGVNGHADGTNNGVLEDCGAEVYVSFNEDAGSNPYPLQDVGGLAGDNDQQGTITNSYAMGDVFVDTDVFELFETGETVPTNWNGHVGGLVGENDSTIQGTIVSSQQQYCEASGRVQGCRNVGGLVGESDGNVTFAKATGSRIVTGARSVGGLIGMVTNVSNAEPGVVEDSFTDKDVTALATVTIGVDFNNDFAYEHIGGLVGQNEGGLLEDCYADGDVDGSTTVHDRVGGLVGAVQASTSPNPADHGNGAGVAVVTDCHATGDVTGHEDVGGLVGDNDCDVADSYATGDVTGFEHVGGLVGDNNAGAHIDDSYAEGDVANSANASEDVAGFVGLNQGTVRRCYTTGAVWGTRHCGGFVGENDNGVISDCYATGNVTVAGFIGDREESGGFVGQNETAGALITRCYATGNLLGFNGVRIGGFVGDNANNGNITNSFATGTTQSGAHGFFGRQNAAFAACFSIEWDANATQTTMQALTDINNGLHTHAVYAAWDFTNVWQVNSDDQAPFTVADLPTLR